MSVSVHHGNVLEVLPTLAADSFHACVCDPPYHLTSIVKRFGGENAAPAQQGTDGAYARASRGFMGKQWDGSDIAFRPETWAEVFRVLKPGAHLLAFGGSRTSHRMACAIEDAGFEIRDTVMWLYGVGFPKSHDVSKGIDRALGAEREVIGVTGRCVGPQETRRTGGLCGSSTFRENLDNPGNLLTAPATESARQWAGWGTALKPAHEPIIVARKPLVGTVAQNVLAHGCGALNIDASRVPIDPAVDDSRLSGNGTWKTTKEQSGNTVSLSRAKIGSSALGRWPSNICHDGSPEVLEAFAAFGESKSPPVGSMGGGSNKHAVFGDFAGVRHSNSFGDSGTAARFFYAAKASKADRAGSGHPTVKPQSLMRYLVRLVTPPGGTVLDPFAGSGSTGQAARAEGFNGVLIEREAEYVADIHERLARMDTDEQAQQDAAAKAHDRPMRDLFASAAE